MNDVWGLIQLMLVAALLSAGITLLATVVFYPRLRPHLGRIEPSLRAVLIMLVALAPVLVAAVLLIASLLPPVGAGLFSMSDHCLAHHDAHAHLCPVHLPAGAGSLAAWLMIALVAFAAAGRTVAVLMRGCRSLQTALRLRRSLMTRRERVLWIDGARPFAFTVGWWRPRTLISTAARTQLSPEGLGVLLGHEEEHRRRHDPLLRSLIETATSLLPQSVRQLLVDDWQLAAEQSCDRAAADRCGDPVEVARTILAVERAMAAGPTPGVAFGGSVIKDRVEHMLRDAMQTTAPRRLRAVAALALVGLLAASPIIHHGLETVLEALLG